MPTVETPGNFVRRHGKRFKVPSCLQIVHLEISAVGMVSALNHHRAYGKVHFSGYTVGTLRQYLYHHAYKIFGESRHDSPFRLISCLLFSSRPAQDIVMMNHFSHYHAYSSLYLMSSNEVAHYFNAHSYRNSILDKIIIQTKLK